MKAILVTACMIMAGLVVLSGASLALPPGKKHEYAGGGAGKVIFDGTVHRGKDKGCSDCHPDVFQMKKNQTMTMADHNAGKLCGHCHNGTVAFDTRDAKNCEKCHKK